VDVARGSENEGQVRALRGVIICRRGRAIESNPLIVQLPQHDRPTGVSVQHGLSAAIDVFALCWLYGAADKR
jgi:hypothetical protein